MPIRSLLDGNDFSPADIGNLTIAFQDTLRLMGLSDREDPATKIVAETIIDLAKQGERDPIRLRERAVELLSN